ncbi:hypothetical protein ACPESV_24350 [Streptomyces umbrinus]|uniref:hypothetical protein n=1 Tax=Streptomyces umbrinus TaxID=67370 RepID=UPI003C2C2CC7
MSDDRILLDANRVIAFYAAFEKRDGYIRAEDLHLMPDGGGSVPLPGCPECGGPAENVMSSLYEDRFEMDVDPCGHRFTTPAPIMVVSSGDGWRREEEWLP